jgi:type IV pilus assembly protein PilM
VSAFLSSSKKTPVIGIDLGSGFIKMAQFKNSPKGLELLNFGLLPINEGLIQEGKIVRPKEVADGVKELLKFHSFVGNRVVAAVSGQLVIVKELLMEDLPENEMEEAIKWEMEKFLPFPIDSAIFDFQVLKKIVVEGEESEKLDVLAVAAPLDAVQSIVDVLKNAELEPVAIEVEAFSELRLLRFIPNFNLEKNDILMIVVNVGHTYTSLNMIDKGFVRFSRTLPFGGKKITEAISQFTGKDAEAAETYKREEFNLLNKNDSVVQVVEPLISSLAIELQRSVDYYFKKFNEGKVMKTVVLLEGGTANLKGLKEFLEEKTGIPVGINKLFTDIARYDPNLFTKEYLEEMAPIFSIATGLALREHPESSIEKARKIKEKSVKKESKNIFKYKKG